MNSEIDDMAEIPMDGTAVTFEGGNSLIADGEYIFKVLQMKRKNIERSEKMPKHVLIDFQIQLENAEGVVGKVWDNLRMYNKWLWKYSAIAKSIGHTPKDAAQVAIDWGRFVASEGLVKISQREWKKTDGTIEKVNDFKYLLPSEKSSAEQPF